MPAKLAADCDIRGVTFDKVVANDIDLKGHALSVRLVTDTTQAMTVTDTVGVGVFRLEVPEGKTALNMTVALTGVLMFVKEGAGRFVAGKTGQTYTGGTEVRAGTFMCGGKGSEGVYGAADGTLTVGPGAAFDCGGYNLKSAGLATMVEAA